MEKLEETIKQLISIGKSEDEVFELVNKILIKSRKRKMRGGEKEVKRKKKRPVCRPVLLISDSSCDE
jgi:hypothetical protein